MNITVVLQFSIIVLITAFILQTQNNFIWATDSPGWSNTDGKFGKQAPTGSVKEWTEVDWKPKWQLQLRGATAVSMPAFLFLPLTPT